MTRRRAPDPDRDARRHERRSELLDAATRVVRREGSAASMEQIAAEAGVSKPIVYRHFRDRDDLVAGVASRFADELGAELATSLHRGSDPHDVLSSTIDAYLAFVERDPEVYRFIVAVARTDGDDTIGGFVREVGRQVAVVLGEQLRDAGLDSGGAEPMAHGIVGMVHNAGDWWLQSRSMPRARVAAYLTDLLWGGITGLGLPAAAGAAAPAEGDAPATAEPTTPTIRIVSEDAR